MIGMSFLFTSYHVSFGKDNGCIADGSYSSVASYGDITVIHVPNFTLNLLSISQLIKIINCSVTFSPSYCLFQDSEIKTTIGMGHEKDDLYILDLDPQSSVASLAIKCDIFPITTNELF